MPPKKQPMAASKNGTVTASAKKGKLSSSSDSSDSSEDSDSEDDEVCILYTGCTCEILNTCFFII